jgi:hypothetical protein
MTSIGKRARTLTAGSAVAAALAVALVAASPEVRADSAVDREGAATARLKFELKIPKFLRLQIGAPTRATDAVPVQVRANPGSDAITVAYRAHGAAQAVPYPVGAGRTTALNAEIAPGRAAGFTLAAP